ncbi:MAG TPA: LysR family transcriptional regulator [Rhodoblastus sp.]|nr:LysR family transcriptional regulator [Rhodoblastus sp.]
MPDRFRTSPDWDDLRHFAAVARRGSLSGAARALGVNHATVARRLAALESALGAKLFERRASGYALNARGRAVMEQASRMEEAVATLGRASPSAVVAGLVRVTATPAVADAFLLPRLARLRRLHPALDLEIVADSRSLSLQRHEADIALRLTRPRDGEIVARKLATIRYGFFATAASRAAMDAGGEPVFVGFDEANAHVPEALFLARHFAGRRIAFRVNSQTAQAAAAAQSLGVALLPRFLGARDKRLMAVDLAPAPPDRSLWLLMRRDAQRPAAVRAVVDFLAEEFAKAATEL